MSISGRRRIRHAIFVLKKLRNCCPPKNLYHLKNCCQVLTNIGRYKMGENSSATQRLRNHGLWSIFEPAPLVCRVRDRLVAHAVVTERRVKDRRQRQIAAQSFVFAMLMVISPWVSWNIINQSAVKEMHALLYEVVSPRPRMVIASRSASPREHDPEQELIDRLAHQRRQILYSLPAMATPALVTSQYW